MHTMEFLIGFHSDRLSNLIHLVNKSSLLIKEKKMQALVDVSCYIRVATINQTLINHFTMYSCQSIQYVVPTVTH